MVREFEERPIENNLSSEMATENPELYKSLLLETLKTKSQLSYSFWQYLIKEGLANADIELNDQNYISESTERGITMGTLPLPENLKKVVMFEEESFGNYETEKAYLLSHEISHKIAALIGTSEKGERFNNLYTTVINFRKTGGKGLSGLGSLDFYKRTDKRKTAEENAQIQAETQAREDLTELLNMYLWNPDYFKRFVEFLADPKFKNIRKKLDIHSLSKEASEHVFKLISESVEEFRKMRNI